MGMGAMTTLTILDDGFDRLIYGFDSFGNICDRKNTIKTQHLSYNGWDTTNYKYNIFQMLIYSILLKLTFKFADMYFF